MRMTLTEIHASVFKNIPYFFFADAPAFHPALSMLGEDKISFHQLLLHSVFRKPVGAISSSEKNEVNQGAAN